MQNEISAVDATVDAVSLVSETAMPSTDVATALPQLPELPSLADAAAIVQKGKVQKDWIQIAAGRLYEYRAVRNTFSAAIAEQGQEIVTSEMRRQWDAAEQAINTILYGPGIDDETRDRIEFASCLVSIDRCDPKDKKMVQAHIDEAVRSGRYYAVSQAEVDAARKSPQGIPQYAIFFFGKTYFPSVFTEPAPGQKALEIKLITLVMKARGDRPISVFTVGREGFYHLACPKASHDNVDGHMLLQVHAELDPKDPIVRVMMGIGNCSHVADPKQGRTSVPLSWVKNGRINSPRRLEPEDFSRSLGLVKRIRYALGLQDPARPAKQPAAATTMATAFQKVKEPAAS